MTAEADVFTLAPSDLTFGLHGCPKCFWHKIVRGERRPPSPMPGVFTRMDKAQRMYFEGRSTQSISSRLPPGKLRCSGLKVMSRPIEVSGHEARIRFRGEMDALGELDGGGYVAVDFKTASWKETEVPCTLQLHAYAWGLENAEFPTPRFAPVRDMGLLYFDPVEVVGDPGGELSFRLKTMWWEVKRDDEWFTEFLGKVCSLLELSAPPLPHPSCGFCSWKGYSA